MRRVSACFRSNSTSLTASSVCVCCFWGVRRPALSNKHRSSPFSTRANSWLREEGWKQVCVSREITLRFHHDFSDICPQTYLLQSGCFKFYMDRQRLLEKLWKFKFVILKCLWWSRPVVRFPKGSLANYGRKLSWIVLVMMELATIVGFGKRTKQQWLNQSRDWLTRGIIFAILFQLLRN